MSHVGVYLRMLRVVTGNAINYCGGWFIMKNLFFSILFLGVTFIASALDNAPGLSKVQQKLVLFPIEHYNQDVNYWLNPKASAYQSNLLSVDYQKRKLSELEHIYYGTDARDRSPWSREYIISLLASQPHLQLVEAWLIDELAHYNTTARLTPAEQQKINYGINFRPYAKAWFDNVRDNMQLPKLAQIHYDEDMRAITTDNVHLRSLPSDDPLFYNSAIAGEGYPFDNLQQTAVFAGTPLYVISVSLDHKWDLVVSPNYVGWIHAQSVGFVDDNFVDLWQAHAYNGLVGVTASNISILNRYGQYQFTGYVGMLFPLTNNYASRGSHVHLLQSQMHGAVRILIPLKDTTGHAILGEATLSASEAAVLPLIASPANFALIIKHLQGRAYGWGNINFYNDCSSELKSIYTLFGIFLPRNTSNQLRAGKVIDLNNLTPPQRLQYLMQHGVPLLTLVYIKGHILLYVGTYSNKDGRKFALSYQEMWGLKPQDLSYRAVVGQSVFLPLLPSYPEDKKLWSQAAFATFKLIYLNQPSTQSDPFRFNLLELTR